MMSKNDFIKLETNSVDEHGPIYVYIEPSSIVALSRFRSATTIALGNGKEYVVKESPSEIFEKIDAKNIVYMQDVVSAFTDFRGDNDDSNW